MDGDYTMPTESDPQRRVVVEGMERFPNLPQNMRRIWENASPSERPRENAKGIEELAMRCETLSRKLDELEAGNHDSSSEDAIPMPVNVCEAAKAIGITLAAAKGLLAAAQVKPFKTNSGGKVTWLTTQPGWKKVIQLIGGEVAE